MINYLKGFTTSSLLFCSIFIFMGAQFGNSQHFGDIIANSITIANKNGFGGILKIVDKDGAKVLSIKNGNIKIFNSENVEVVSINSSKEGKGNIFLNHSVQNRWNCVSAFFLVRLTFSKSVIIEVYQSKIEYVLEIDQ